MSFYSRFASAYEAVFPFSRDVYDYLQRHLPPTPASLLDVGCATGHYAGPLALEGYALTALDLDPEMIAYAGDHYAGVDFRVMDMLDIASLGLRFDGVFCIGNTAAHLAREQFGDFVTSVNSVLTPAGVFILQVMNWDHVLGQSEVTFPTIRAPGEVVFHRFYRDISDVTVTFATRLEVAGHLVFDDAVPLYPIRSGEIVAMCEPQGFQLVEHVGSYAGARFDPEVFSASIFVFLRAGQDGV